MCTDKSETDMTVNRQHAEDKDEDQTGSGHSCCCLKGAVGTVLSCTAIFFSFSLVDQWITTKDEALGYTADWGERGQREVRRVYTGVSSIATIFAALVSLKVGYRIVAISGCLMMMCGMFVASWLDKAAIGLIGVLIGGITGVGASCLKLVAVVPVLENIDNCRFIAVGVVNIGGACASVIHYGIMSIDDVNLNWKLLYRWQIVIMIFAFFVSLRLGSTNEKWIKTYYSPFDWSILHQKSLYILMTVLLLDRFGQFILSKEIFTFFDTSDSSSAPYLGGFFYYGGQILGPIFMFCCIKKEIVSTLCFMGPIAFISGIWTIGATWSTNLLHISIYAAILGISKVAFTTLLQNLIPTVYGKKNVRIVKGLLEFSAGVGILLSSPCQYAVGMSYDEVERYKPAFYLAGCALVLASGFVFLCVQVVRETEDYAKVSVVNEIAMEET